MDNSTASIVGFIGTGVMGGPMAGHLVDAGYAVKVFTRTREKADWLLDKGATWATPEEMIGTCDVFCTMLGYPADVESIYFGHEGLVPNARKGSLFCDFTTSSPELAVRIHDAAAGRAIGSLDAPVSGGDIGAKNGTLSIMCGGPEETFQELKPMLDVFGSNVVYQGPAGSGQHTKMCNQISIAGMMISVCEAVLYAEAAGLDPNTVLSSIASGAAGSWTMSNLVPRILDGNFEPGFYVEHYIKDMDIAIEESKRLGLETPALDLARSLYQKLKDKGLERKGTQALYLALKSLS